MFVIEVIPLIRGTRIDTLSYFSGIEYPVGSFVTIPIRGKEHKAVVTGVTPVAHNKSSLKSASFTLRKLPEQAPSTTVPTNISATAQKLTQLYPTSVGAILYQLLPTDVRTGQYQYPMVSSLIHKEDTIPQILTAAMKDRYVAYRSHIRGVLARRGSVVFVVPTSADVAYAQKHLSQGIEDRVVVFSPTQLKTERQKSYAAYEDTSLAKLIITTPSHAYLDRVDLLAIVIENASSDFYRSATRPYLDHKVVLETFAKVTGRSILLGDILPKTEDEYKRRNEVFSTYNEETKRITFSSPLSIIEQRDKSTPEAPFSLFSKELKAKFGNVLDAKGRIFMYGARRGIAPVVTCIDCGHIFRCPDSQTPYSLVKTTSKTGNEDRWFVSSTSGKKIRAADTCPTCGSWRLRPRGIGIQQVYDEAVTTFPTSKVFLLDHVTGSTRKRAKKIIDDFYATRGAILVGTQMTIPYLGLQGADISAIISLDATRANPTWRADENVFRLLLQLREQSTQEVLVQTRTTPDSVLQNAIHGSVEVFYNEEIELREMLNYPPFSCFVLLSWVGEKAVVLQIEEQIKQMTAPAVASFYSNPSSTDSKVLRHALFRLDQSAKNRTEFIEVLRKLPPFIRIEVDPNRIV